MPNDADQSTACDCCDRPVSYVRGSPWHGTSKLCVACFYVWYDEGEVEPDRIKAKVLAAEAAGAYPFNGGDQRVMRVP